MNIFKRAEWLAVAKDRTAIVLLAMLLVAGLALIAVTVLRLHPNDIQVPVRYTGYGQSFIYRDQWYVQISYALFALIITFTHGVLGVKLYQLRRQLGLGVLGIGIFILIFAIIVATSIFNLAPVL